MSYTRVVTLNQSAVKDGHGQMLEYGHLGQSTYRVEVHIDGSYQFQSRAGISTWGVGGWNELIRYLPGELPRRLTEDGRTEMGEVSEHLIEDAADLLFGPEFRSERDAHS